jgi:hypothetical protein
MRQAWRPMQRQFRNGGIGERHNYSCTTNVEVERFPTTSCSPVNPLVFFTLDWVKKKALVFFQFPLLSKKALPVFSLVLMMYFASSVVTIIVGWVSVERVVCTVADHANILSLGSR